MSGSVISSPVAYVDALGIHVPTYEQVLTFYQNAYRDIYGSDVYLENDSQDGQVVALWSKGMHDANSLAVAVYNSLSPSGAQGSGLSSNVKVNGITRKVSSFSTAAETISGNVGCTILGGIVSDGNSNWALPASVTIPPSGSISVTVTCLTAGAISADAGTINTIVTPTLGWVSATNPAAAVPGAPVETDTMLRQRQSVSAALGSTGTTDALLANLLALPGVMRLRVYENNTAVADTVNSIPAGAVGVVIEGGDVNQIAQTIFNTKRQGAIFVGSTTINVTDAYGVINPISFWPVSDIETTITITLKALAGYNTNVQTALTAALLAGAQDATNGSNTIGQTVYVSRFYSYAFLPQAQGGTTYDIRSIVLSAPGITADNLGNLLFSGSSAPLYDLAHVVVVVT